MIEKLLLEDKEKNIPHPAIIEKIREEEERKRREIEEGWRRQPIIEDRGIPYWRKPEKEENRYK